jgi:hypothetical protein
LTETLEEELLPKVNELLDTPILAIKINSVNEGSIEIIFSALVSAYQFISSISGFFDSIELIKDTAKSILIKKLNKDYGYFLMFMLIIFYRQITEIILKRNVAEICL